MIFTLEKSKAKISEYISSGFVFYMHNLPIILTATKLSIYPELCNFEVFFAKDLYP